MPRQPTQVPESFQDLHFPLCGLDLQYGFDSQSPRPLSNGQYARTTPLGVNVRAYEPSTDRARGGSRPGTIKYQGQVAAGSIQDLNYIVNMSGSTTVHTDFAGST